MGHGGEYPHTMPQAIRLVDAEGRSCIYVPVMEDGEVVDSRIRAPDDDVRKSVARGGRLTSGGMKIPRSLHSPAHNSSKKPVYEFTKLSGNTGQLLLNPINGENLIECQLGANVEGISMTAAIARIFPHASLASIADIDAFVTVSLISGVGLLLSLSVLILDQYIPGDWF